MKIITYKEWWKLPDEERLHFTGAIKNRSKIEYLQNGYLHNLNGPAVFWFSSRIERFYIKGIFYKKEDWARNPEVIRNSKEFKDVLKYRELV